ncbi:MAG: rhodanese-like domain-containing protein [Pseudomonadota bacterium]
MFTRTHRIVVAARTAVVAAATAGFLTAGAGAASAEATGWTPLIAPAALAAMEAEPLLLDIRSGKAYRTGHAPGAVSAPYNLWRGPKENPGRTLSDASLTALLSGLGVARDRAVVVTYQGRNATDFGAAARVYWTLKSAGVERIAILNGGLNAWVDAGLPLSKDAATPMPSAIEATLSDRWMIDRAGVADVVAGRSAARLVDARPLEFFEGRKKHDAAAKAGTLKGALNVIHSAWFGAGEHQMVSTPEAATEIARRAGYEGALTDGETLVSFCNTGHWAATNWFALSEIAGIENVKLYPESMVGWTNAGGDVVAQ